VNKIATLTTDIIFEPVCGVQKRLRKGNSFLILKEDNKGCLVKCLFVLSTRRTSKPDPEKVATEKEIIHIIRFSRNEYFDMIEI